MIIEYGERETAYLKSKDAHLGEAIDKFGFISREADENLFSSLVNAIVGQQISSKAQAAVWNRLLELTGAITPERIYACSEEILRGLGMSLKKAGCIRTAAKAVIDKTLDIGALSGMTDEDVCAELTKLPGVGRWTAEMLLIFSMRRPDVLSFGDYGIKKGLCIIHGHEKIDKQLFLKYKRLYSPYATVASLYLWAVANNA